MSQTEELLLQGQILREQGKTFEALDYLNKALEAFAKEKNYARFAHALLDRAICWQHLYQFNNNDPGFAVLYKKDAEAMLEVLENNHIKEELSGAYFINARAASLFGDFGKAIKFFKKALELLPSSMAAQRGDWQTNLGKSLYFAGEKERGLNEIMVGIEQIKNHLAEVGDYAGKVWLSGGYMRLAEVLLKDDRTRSREYLKMAKGIVASDKKFMVRQKQISNFEQTGKSGL